MSDAYWEILERLFAEGSDLPREARATWLRQLDVDEALRYELAGMLAVQTADADFAQQFESALLQAFDATMPGTRLGPYRLLRELGSGGMGLVFLAERADEHFRQQVAIKVIRDLGGQYAGQQLRHERQILAELTHPNIARLLDGGETAQGQPYLVMEYVPGEPVVQACTARQMPLAQRVALVRDLAHAVHYAHQRLIVHRDIKPANVLLREDGRPILLDFGIAKLLDPVTRASVATHQWFTPAYASPEQRRGEALSTATDVYGLGLLLSELLTDTAPVPDAAGNLPPPSQVAERSRRSALRRDLDRIVLRATASDPARRYSSAEALADDLQRYLADKPVLAVPDSLAYRLNKRVRRHPYASVAALIGVVLLTWSAWRVIEERRHAEHEAQTSAAVTDYLVELFREADPERTRGAPITPMQLIELGSERLSAATDVSAAQRARLQGTFGDIYLILGQPEKATDALKAALASGQGSVEEQALWLQNLGSALLTRAMFNDAAERYRASAQLLRTQESPGMLAESLAGLGITYSRIDRNEEAAPLLREAIAIQTGVDGPASVDTLRYKSYLSEALFNVDRKTEARALMEEAIAGLRVQLEPDDLHLTSALTSYGMQLAQVGETDAAEKIYLEILAKQRKLLGHDSQHVQVVHSQLAILYNQQGRTREAIDHMRAAYEVGRREGADDDPARAVTRSNMAAMYIEIGDYAQAEALLVRAVQIMERPPASALQTAVMRINYGRLLMLAGKAEEARVWLEKPLVNTIDPNWITLRGVRRLYLAEWHRRYGDPGEAARLLADALAHLDDIGGPDGPRMATLERTRGLLAAAQGDRVAARKDLESARTHLVEKRGARYVGVGDLSLDLAELALADGDRERARNQWRQAHDILDPQLAPNAPQRARLASLQQVLER